MRLLCWCFPQWKYLLCSKILSWKHLHVGSVFKGLEITETILIKMEEYKVGKKLLRMTEQAYIKFNIVKQIILSHLHPKREIK